jgi:hypothetical protein
MHTFVGSGRCSLANCALPLKGGTNSFIPAFSPKNLVLVNNSQLMICNTTLLFLQHWHCVCQAYAAKLVLSRWLQGMHL